MGRVRCDKLFCHMNTKTSILMAKARRPLGCGVRKFGILLTVMAAAIIALPNTVTNDVVVATSDAELRISDRDLGLGLEVVGGGAAEAERGRVVYSGETMSAAVNFADTDAWCI